MNAIDDQLTDTRTAVDEIVKQFEKHGLRARPFSYVPFNATAADLRKAATDEVRRSLDRIPLVMEHGALSLHSHTPLDDERGEVARLHRIPRELDRYSGVPVIKAAISWLDSIGRQEPPPRVDTGRWVCSGEAYDLVNTLCAARPTRYREGLFIQTAVRLYEVCIGPTTTDDMYRVCSAVLKARRRLDCANA